MTVSLEILWSNYENKNEIKHFFLISTNLHHSIIYYSRYFTSNIHRKSHLNSLILDRTRSWFSQMLKFILTTWKFILFLIPYLLHMIFLCRQAPAVGLPLQIAKSRCFSLIKQPPTANRRGLWYNQELYCRHNSVGSCNLALLTLSAQKDQLIPFDPKSQI